MKNTLSQVFDKQDTIRGKVISETGGRRIPLCAMLIFIGIILTIHALFRVSTCSWVGIILMGVLTCWMIVLWATYEVRSHRDSSFLQNRVLGSLGIIFILTIALGLVFGGDVVINAPDGEINVTQIYVTDVNVTGNLTVAQIYAWVGINTSTLNAPTGRTATYIVCAYDAETTTQCDYTCDGIDDHIQIQQAIYAQNYSNGGSRVVLSDGQFYVNHTIYLHGRLTLEGQNEESTVIHLVDNADCDMFKFVGGQNEWWLTLKQFGANGNRANQGSSSDFLDTCDTYSLQDGTLRDLWIQSFKGHGVSLDHGWGWVIDNIVVEFCDGSGLTTTAKGGNPKISNSKFITNEQYGAYIDSPHTHISNCEFGSNDTNYAGLYLHSNYNMVTASTMGGYDTAGFGLLISGNHSSIVGNQLSGAWHAFRVTPPTVGNKIIGNHFLSGVVSLQSTNNQIKYNTGVYVSENSGNATKANTNTITHGLDCTPLSVRLTTSNASHSAGVTAIGSSTFTVGLVDYNGAAVTVAETVYWTADC